MPTMPPPGRPRLPVLLVLLVGLAGCAGCAGPAPATAPSVEPDALRVMSFNLRLDAESDGDDAWPNRREAAARTMDGADLVGVQEALPSMLEWLDGRLPGYARIGVGRNADGGGEASAIYYRTDRLELRDDGTFWLSETPDVPGSQSWDAALPRIATWGRFLDRQTGREVVHVNTHFDHVGETARRESARLLVERLPELAGGAPAVLTGDLNATPDTEVYTTFVDGGGLEDAWTAAPATSGPAGTWNAFGAYDGERRIDYVFTLGPARALEARTLDATIGQVTGTDSRREVSDHYPVEALVVMD